MAQQPGFAQHLDDAIRLNASRKAFYSRLTGGRSEQLSDRLIEQERLCLLIAWYFDWRAAEYQREGIPIVAGDLLPMDAVKPETSPPARTGVAAEADLTRAREVLERLGHDLERLLGQDDFQGVADACHGTLGQIGAIEERAGASFAMSHHIVESIGLGALNAIDHARRSQGRTTWLSGQFLRTQAFALGSCVETDALAQQSHRLGAGILVNDVPAIPFEARYRELAR